MEITLLVFPRGGSFIYYRKLSLILAGLNQATAFYLSMKFSGILCFLEYVSNYYQSLKLKVNTFFCILPFCMDNPVYVLYKKVSCKAGCPIQVTFHVYDFFHENISGTILPL